MRNEIHRTTPDQAIHAHLVVTPPLFGAALGLAPMFWICGVLPTTGLWINRRPQEKRN